MTGDGASEILHLQEGLQVRKKGQSLLVYWKSTCLLNNIEMQREICEQIDHDSAAFWLFVLSNWGLAGTKYEGLRLSKTDKVMLIFPRALTEPTSVILGVEAQAKLKILLEE